MAKARYWGTNLEAPATYLLSLQSERHETEKIAVVPHSKKGWLFLVDAAVESFDELSCTNSECVADTKKSPDGDGPASFYLLPMSSRKPETNHVLLGVASRLAQLLNSLAQSLKKLSFVDHIGALEDYKQKHHEQNSWTDKYRNATLCLRTMVRTSNVRMTKKPLLFSCPTPKPDLFREFGVP